jgi:hypothetical protein
MPSPRLLVLLLPMACAACAPLPHVVTLTPDITGTLTRDGVPVAGQDVHLARGPEALPCSATVATARTDAEGRFRLARQTQLRFIYAPLVAPLSISEFQVCITGPGASQLLLHRSAVMLYNAIPLALNCTLVGRTLEGLPQTPPCREIR